MKKTPLLNAELSFVVAGLGHMDLLVIADAGLPIPPETLCIDLALTQGVPGFVETLETVLTELQVERVILAEETAQVSPHIRQAVSRLLPGVSLETMPHERLKELSARARAIVRTGEFTPYANIILVSGVVF